MFITTTVINDISDLNFVINAPLKVPLIAVEDKTSNNNAIIKNMWVLSFSLTAINEIHAQDLIKFVAKFLEKKRQEITQKGIASPIVFYMWFDEMAAQLRFNTIIAFNKKLPFGCKVDIVDSPEPIIQDFLASHYHDGIPWSELEESEDDLDEDEEPFILKVFVVHIN